MSNEPNRINLSNGGYLLFDYHQGFYRMAIYNRHVSKSHSLLGALGLALNKPTHHKQVTEMAKYITSQFEKMNTEQSMEIVID